MGITFANFMVPGTCPLSIDVLIIMDKGSAISFLRSFTSFDDKPSWPQLFLGFNSFIILITSHLSVGCKNNDLEQLPIKYSLNCLEDGPIEAAHWWCYYLQGAVAGIGRSLRRDEDPSSRLASLRTREVFYRIVRVRPNEAPRLNDSVYSRRGHCRTAHG